MPDFEKQKWRSRIEAALLDAGSEHPDDLLGKRKTDVIGTMSGTVVEFGPGTGANMRYYAPGVHVIGIEPNPHMHGRLREQADRHGVDLEIRGMRGESIDVADGSADGVVGTLLLCGVDDPDAVVSEAHRVLVPGGTYFFVEHVEAPEDSPMRRVQRLVRRPHAWMFNGCRVDQRTADVIRRSSFDDIVIDDLDRGRSALHVRHQIVGTAVKSDAATS